MDEMMPSRSKVEALIALRKQFTGVDAVSQCRLLLEALRLFPITTFEASRYLDIYDPRRRIKDLRERGHVIDMVKFETETEAGVKHRIGKYLLVREAGLELAA